MLTRTTAALLCLLCLVPASAGMAQQQPNSELVVPVGTMVPLTLVSAIKSKSTRPGDAVRAVVAFPVAVGGRVAIPADTYVEGVLAPPAAKVKHQPDPDVQLHLTRLVFANGYTVPLNAVQARATVDDGPASASSEGEGTRESAIYEERQPMQVGNSFAGQTTPSQTLPPLHSDGPSVGVLAGVGAGVIGAIATIGILNRNGARKSDRIVHDAGWQFQIKLESPLTLDTSRTGVLTSR